jgi:hypothetical protein
MCNVFVLQLNIIVVSLFVTVNCNFNVFECVSKR